MEPIQSITEEKKQSTPASPAELKISEVKPAQSRSAVFPILFVVAALLFAGALFFSLQGGELPYQAVSCTQDTDCIIVDAPGCCEQSVMESVNAVNKEFDYKKWNNKHYNKTCSRVECDVPQDGMTHSSVTKCINQKCVVEVVRKKEDVALPVLSSSTVSQTGKSTCIDSDPKNDIYTKGNVTISYGEQRTVYDYCSGTGKQVSKMWCYESPKGSGNYVNGNMMKDCPNGCYDGRCLKEGEVDPAISSPHLHLLSPKGGESLCVGEEYIIRWEGPKELSTVSLWVHKGTAAAWNIEDLPATFNESNTPGKGEFVWKVGASKKGMIPEGYAYTLGISGNYPQSMRQTNDYFQTDKPFSLINCQG